MSDQFRAKRLEAFRSTSVRLTRSTKEVNLRLPPDLRIVNVSPPPTHSSCGSQVLPAKDQQGGAQIPFTSTDEQKVGPLQSTLGVHLQYILEETANVSDNSALDSRYSNVGDLNYQMRGSHRDEVPS